MEERERRSRAIDAIDAQIDAIRRGELRSLVHKRMGEWAGWVSMIEDAAPPTVRLDLAQRLARAANNFVRDWGYTFCAGDDVEASACFVVCVNVRGEPRYAMQNSETKKRTGAHRAMRDLLPQPVRPIDPTKDAIDYEWND
jgi:hypothetical protein